MTDQIPGEDTPKPPVEEPPITPDPETPPETPAPAPVSPTADQLAETTRVMKEISDRLKPGDPAPSREQMRELVKEKTGLSDAGIDWVMDFNRQTVIAAVSPLSERLAWQDLRSSKANTAFPVTPEIEKGMKDELKQYPEQMKGDSVLLEKIYLMELGKQQLAGKLPAPKTPATPPNPNPAPNNPVVRRTIVNNNPNPAGGNGGGNPNPTPANTLSNEEKAMARKMGISEADYAKSKSTTIISALK